ncbi:TfpX/TfpZ family type IV pilin accessory protein [Acinetobacter johnsonii]|uniref:Type IV pilin accessory protein n=1 Tax=Acinetobacter johnsonii TaxID=40214 RepID=A0A380U6I9_ACIJO|nr:TfpX/TfpZ family type IV pilin accessory protein [Acinetobacter johnsonii]ENU38173.1 hypothetical protein F986_03288 [Acinetobacter johnsonii CIP 64.6]QPS04170.1 type IV pilin accessory protein [Acinetobacter johnsonii]SUT97628.1 type IV pilin accessory protein [Acinetobacter johnsonii]
MKLRKFPKRIKYFLSHLFLSLIVALVIVGLTFFIWYPSPLDVAADVTHVFLMLLVIDIILGPILGLLIYKEGKKSLKFDLTVIILLQLSALCYGIYSIEQGRPAWLVFYADRFELVRKNEIIQDNIANALPQYQQSSWFKPQYVTVEFSEDVNQRNYDMFTEVFGGISLAQRPERYVELNKAKKQMQQRAQKLELLQQYNNKADVEKILAKYPQATAFLPMKANAVDMTVLIDQKANVVKIVDLRPWK